jgi:phosphoglycerate kinase
LEKELSVIKMTDLDLKGKRVLIREDLNVPQADDGAITDDTRIRASMPTIQHAAKAGAKVMLMSHLGRPEEGIYSEADSLKPVAKRLSDLLGKEIRVIKDWLDGGFTIADGEVVLFENVRFNKGEGKNNDDSVPRIARRLLPTVWRSMRQWRALAHYWQQNWKHWAKH